MLTNIDVNVNPSNRFSDASKIANFMRVEQEKFRFASSVLANRFDLDIPAVGVGPYRLFQTLIYKFAHRWGQRVYHGPAKYLTSDEGWFPHESYFYSAVNLSQKPAKGKSTYPVVYAGTFSELTPWLVLDIDKNSKYQKPKEWRALKAFLTGLGCRLDRYRSDYVQTNQKTGKPGVKSGWHVYIYFNRAEPTKRVKNFFTNLLNDNGFDVIPGQLEVHPGSSLIRMPLQEGFKPIGRSPKNQISLVKQFLYRMTDDAWDFTRFYNSVHPENNVKSFSTNETEATPIYSAKGVIQEYIDYSIEFLRKGLTGFHTSHYAIMALSHYYWYKIGSNNDGRAERIIEDLKQRHNGFCKHINQQQWTKLETEIWQCVSWRPKDAPADKEFRPNEVMMNGLTLNQMQIANLKRQTTAQQKILGAIKSLVDLGKRVTYSAIQTVTGCSKSTLSKYKNWLRDPGGTLQYVGSVSASFVGADGRQVEKRVLEPALFTGTLDVTTAPLGAVWRRKVLDWKSGKAALFDTG